MLHRNRKLELQHCSQWLPVRVKEIVRSKPLTLRRGYALQFFGAMLRRYLQRSEFGTQVANNFLLWQLPASNPAAKKPLWSANPLFFGSYLQKGLLTVGFQKETQTKTQRSFHHEEGSACSHQGRKKNRRNKEAFCKLICIYHHFSPSGLPPMGY